MDKIKELKNLKELLETGAITESESKQLKEKILIGPESNQKEKFNTKLDTTLFEYESIPKENLTTEFDDRESLSSLIDNSGSVRTKFIIGILSLISIISTSLLAFHYFSDVHANSTQIPTESVSVTDNAINSEPTTISEPKVDEAPKSNLANYKINENGTINPVRDKITSTEKAFFEKIKGNEELITTNDVLRYFEVIDGNVVNTKNEFIYPNDDLINDQYLSYSLTFSSIDENMGAVKIDYEFDAGTSYRGTGNIFAFKDQIIHSSNSCGVTNCTSFTKLNGEIIMESSKENDHYDN